MNIAASFILFSIRISQSKSN